MSMPLFSGSTNPLETLLTIFDQLELGFGRAAILKFKIATKRSVLPISRSLSLLEVRF